MNRYGRVLFIAGIVILVVLAAGCLSSPAPSGGGTLKQTDAVTYPESAGVSINSRSVAPAPTQGLSGEKTASSLVSDQKIIRRASVQLEVLSTQTALDAIRQIALTQGGYVGSSNMNRGSSGRYSGSITLRVPPEHLEPTLTAIGGLGKVLSQSIQAEDVTEEYIDLTARRQALVEERGSYERIMQKADKVEDILRIQEQISRVQSEIDRIDGRLKYLSNRVEYATVTAQVSEPEPVGSTTGLSFSEVINQGIEGFYAVVAGIVIGLLIALPFIIIAGAGYLIYRRFWKKPR